MDKKVLIIAGIVLIVTIFALGIGLKSKPASKTPKVNQTQTMPKEKIKARNEALINISGALDKARQGELEEAMKLCDKALELAPDEPITQNCKAAMKHIK